jgi:hypothetical protein
MVIGMVFHRVAGMDFTSPLMGEVAAKLRVGVTVGCHKRSSHPVILSLSKGVPTLPIKGRVKSHPPVKLFKLFAIPPPISTPPLVSLIGPARIARKLQGRESG